MDVVVYDVPQNVNRFTIIYALNSLHFNTRFYTAFQTNEITPVPSLTKTFKTAYWIEREIWDMFGILFLKHSDLRRILTDYNFVGHPLRKDFPTTGFIDIFYDEKEKKIEYTPIELAQEYRNYTVKKFS